MEKKELIEGLKILLTDAKTSNYPYHIEILQEVISFLNYTKGDVRVSSVAATGSTGDSREDVGGLKDGAVKELMQLFLKDTKKHIQACRRNYVKKYQHEVDQMEKDYRIIQSLLGESLSV